MSAPQWPIEIRPVGHASCGAVLWHYRGRLQVTAIVKGVFALAPDAAMTLAAPEPVLADDLHHHGDPRHSVLAASDLSPYRSKADVIVTGSVYATAEQSARGVNVRVAV